MPFSQNSSSVVSARRLIGIGGALTFVSGLINSVSFMAFGSFVSHVSGHATRFAIALSENHFEQGWVFLLAIFWFIIGSATTAFLMRGRFLTSGKSNSLLPIFIEAGLIAYVCIHAQFVHQNGSLDSHTKVFHLLVLSLAMGMQNALLRQTSGVIIRTTHLTGISTDIGISIGWFLSNLWHFLPRSINNINFAEAKQKWREFISSLHWDHLILQLCLLAGFIIGATIGTFGYIHYGLNTLFLSIFILIISGTVEYKKHHWHAE